LAQLGSLVGELQGHGASLVGISVTALFSQAAFHEHLGIDFPLISDWNQEVCAAYGVRYDNWKGHQGLAKRALFVIDKTKTVRYVWSDDDALVLPDLDPLMAAVAAI
jgi:peroxiredoxin